MKHFAILAAALLFGQSALAGPNWQVTTFTMEPQHLSDFQAATEKLMSSPAGKELTGSVSLMVQTIDGSDPATHSFITSFNSLAAREAWFQKLQAIQPGTRSWRPSLRSPSKSALRA